MNRHSVPNAILGLPGKPANGGSQPRFYDFDDGVTRLVKWSPSPHGAKACYNELVASRLGQLIEAPILRGVVVFVAAEIIPAEHKAEAAKPGFHFGIARMRGENFVPTSHYTEIENSSELPAAAVHIAWLNVGDQQGHNQFLQVMELEEQGVVKKTKRFKLIDMGQMFGDWNWTAATVVNVQNGYALPQHLGEKLTKAKLAPAIQMLKDVSDENIKDCFQDCPADWNVSQEEKDAGAARAVAAKAKIEEIIFNGNPSIK